MSEPHCLGWVAVSYGHVDPRWALVRNARAMFGPGLAGLALPDQARIVDHWVHSNIRFLADIGDEWSLPDDTLRRGFGDCEDHALLKRALLLGAGVDEELLTFLVVWDTIARCHHALLMVETDEGRLILDSSNMLCLPDTEVRDYEPRLGYRGEHAWMYGRRVV